MKGSVFSSVILKSWVVVGPRIGPKSPSLDLSVHGDHSNWSIEKELGLLKLYIVYDRIIRRELVKTLSECETAEALSTHPLSQNLIRKSRQAAIQSPQQV